jgi:hypothetical protein
VPVISRPLSEDGDALLQVPARRRTSDRVRFTLRAEMAVIPFILVALALWIVGNGIPYGYDAIEVYYTYLIGHNAATFPGVNPLMADLAVSPDLTAHPYYYTHHPNLFSQLLSQVLIRGGVVDLRFHNLISIGIAATGLVFAAKVLRQIGGAALAVTTLLIFSAHYVGALTWANHLLRSMAFPLFWINVYVTLRYLDHPRRKNLIWVLVAIFALFLNDFTIGPYFLLVVILLAWQARISPRQKAALTVLMSSAAVVAVGLWLLVLVNTLGWNVVRQDIIYTYLGRNDSEVIQSPQAIADFYRANNIVFWGSFIPTEDRWGMLGLAYTTAFTLGHGVVALVLYPIIGAALLVAPLHRLLRLSGRVVNRRRVGAYLAFALAVIGGASVLKAPALLADWGLRTTSAPWALLIVGVCLSTIAVLAMLRGRMGQWAVPEFFGGPPQSVHKSAVTLQTYCIAMGLATLLMTWGSFGGFTMGLVIGYKPGLIFLEDVVLAALVLQLCRTASGTSARRLLRAGAALGLVCLATYWLAYQAKLVNQYAPTEIAAAAPIRENEALRGASYVTPIDYHIVWYYAGGTGHHVDPPAAGESALDMDRYAFFHDYRTRPDAYLNPDYFVCAAMHTQPPRSCGYWVDALTRLGYIRGNNYASDPSLDYLLVPLRSPG